MKTKILTSYSEFEKVIQAGVSLVDFNAPWCGPCHSQEPIINHMAAQLKDRVTVAAINLDKHQDLAVKLGIQSIPTLIIFKNGKEIQRFVGLQHESILYDALENVLI